ncbi:MAG: MFS transporter [bacterium]
MTRASKGTRLSTRTKSSKRSRVSANLGVLLGCVLLIGLGEELWSKFVPPYLLLLGGSAWVVAVYGTLRDFLDAIYPYPGGWLNDRWGSRRALLGFTALSMAGYVFYLFSPNAPLFLVGTCLALAWTSFSMPALFDIVAKALPSAQRTWGFSLQAILKRIPIVIGPLLGGLLISVVGLKAGFKAGLVLSLFLAGAALWIIRTYYPKEKTASIDSQNTFHLWKTMDRRLKSLLAADCFIRLAEGIPDVFVALYVMEVLRDSAFQFGWLVGLQMMTSILLYLPVAKWAGGMNRKPLVLLTFAFFALYPLAVIHAKGLGELAIAFVVGGLREIGEPARKAMIADLAGQAARGRVVGLYYLIRGFVVFPAALLGGWLWTQNTRLPFETAFILGLVGLLFFSIWGRDLRKDRS